MSVRTGNLTRKPYFIRVGMQCFSNKWKKQQVEFAPKKLCFDAPIAMVDDLLVQLLVVLLVLFHFFYSDNSRGSFWNLLEYDFFVVCSNAVFRKGHSVGKQRGNSGWPCFCACLLPQGNGNKGKKVTWFV